MQTRVSPCKRANPLSLDALSGAARRGSRANRRVSADPAPRPPGVAWRRLALPGVAWRSRASPGAPGRRLALPGAPHPPSPRSRPASASIVGSPHGGRAGRGAGRLRLRGLARGGRGGRGAGEAGAGRRRAVTDAVSRRSKRLSRAKYILVRGRGRGRGRDGGTAPSDITWRARPCPPRCRGAPRPRGRGIPSPRSAAAAEWTRRRSPRRRHGALRNSGRPARAAALPSRPLRPNIHGGEPVSRACRPCAGSFQAGAQGRARARARARAPHPCRRQGTLARPQLPGATAPRPPRRDPRPPKRRPRSGRARAQKQTPPRGPPPAV